MQDQFSPDISREKLRPLVDAALQLIDQMQANAPPDGALRLARAHAHGTAKNCTHTQFIVECLTFLGVLRGTYNANDLPYAAQPLENDLRELLKSYRAGHVLVTTKDTPLW